MSDWFYLDRGNKIGPILASDFAALFAADKIDRETHVWNASMKEWKPISETELNSIFPQSVAPPIPAAQINNSWVWTVALLPLILGTLKHILMSSMASSVDWSPASILAYKNYLEFLESVMPFVFFGANTFLCWEDEKRLSAAGYNTKNMMWAAIFLVPGYLFWRANKVKQFPSYAITWLVALIISIAL